MYPEVPLLIGQVCSEVIVEAPTHVVTVSLNGNSTAAAMLSNMGPAESIVMFNVRWSVTYPPMGTRQSLVVELQITPLLIMDVRKAGWVYASCEAVKDEQDAAKAEAAQERNTTAVVQ
jgi:hypothetical protein